MNSSIAWKMWLGLLMMSYPSLYFPFVLASDVIISSLTLLCEKADRGYLLQRFGASTTFLTVDSLYSRFLHLRHMSLLLVVVRGTNPA
jgi:hypothetical protein